MKILHYSLGVPPYRSGGLTKYSFDLMVEQSENDNDVYLLYPGHYSIFSKTKIIKNKSMNNIKVFEIINPLPVPLVSGIKNPDLFYKKKNDEQFVIFLKSIRPSIIHIHTFMGLPVEFLKVAKELGIQTVFTSHDYFGFCPVVSLLNDRNKICNDYRDGLGCINCNKEANSFLKIIVMQSKFYRNIKQSFLADMTKVLISKVKSIKPSNKSTIKDNTEGITIKYHSEEIKQYKKLRNYYLKMYNLISYFHFNSSLAKDVYNSYGFFSGDVISISHSNICDNRVLKDYTNDKLNLTYLGPSKEHKGFFLLLDTLSIIIGKGINNWNLNVYGNNYSKLDSKLKNNVKVHGKYKYKHLKKIFEKTDVLVIPSIWNETFGFIVLEAISFGVPVIISNTVGSKDLIINKELGMVIDSTKESLYKNLVNVIQDKNILKGFNDNIMKLDFTFTMDEHEKSIKKLYNKIIEN